MLIWQYSGIPNDDVKPRRSRSVKQQEQEAKEGSHWKDIGRRSIGRTKE